MESIHLRIDVPQSSIYFAKSNYGLAAKEEMWNTYINFDGNTTRFLDAHSSITVAVVAGITILTHHL